jgi:hypothetical protein
MVRALQEAWRVLILHGILIDLRPLCVDVPLEIVTPSGSESAGLVDMSPEIDLDIASDTAIQVVIYDGLLKKRKQEYFDFAYYWSSVREFKADLDKRWRDEIILPGEVLKQARVIFKKHQDSGRVRIRLRMTLAKFTKV